MKKEITREYLKQLAKKVRLEINQNEESFFLESLCNVQEMTENLYQIESFPESEKTGLIISNSLNIDDLSEIENQKIPFLLDRESIRKNGKIENDMFVFNNKK